jgi:hypothetical protein
MDELGAAFDHPKGGPLTWVRCPYGAPGDRLWVREAWSVNGIGVLIAGDVIHSAEIGYRADGGEISWECPPAFYERENDREAFGVRSTAWRPSIHLPRWASRLTLEIVDVRVERLQSISVADAEAEGWGGYLNSAIPGDDLLCYGNGPRTWFRKLWDSINAARGFGWDANPWCWAITFRRVEG